MTATEDLLRDALRARADRTAYQPTPVAHVADRARFLRRRRNAVASLATVAAAAAIAIPLGIVTGDGPGRTSEPIGPADAPTTVEAPPLRRLPEGAPPRIDHIDNGTYVFASGERFELPIGAWQDAAPYRGQLVITYLSPDGIPEIRHVDPSGGEDRAAGCGSAELAVSADGGLTAVAYDDGCTGTGPHTLEWATAAETRTSTAVGLREPGEIRPVGMAEDRMVLVVDAASGEPGRVEVVSAGGEVRTVPGLVTATAFSAAEGLVAGCTAEGTCRVVAEDDGAVSYTLEEAEQPLAFSPDGRYLATRTRTEGGSVVVALRDAVTGDAEVAMRGAGVHGGAVAWEDPEHLLVHWFEFGENDGWSALVRLGTDGSVDRATSVAERGAGITFPGADE